MAFTVTLQPSFDGWHFRFVDSPIGRQVLIDKYNLSTVGGRILEHGYELYYGKDLLPLTQLQIVRINKEIPGDTEDILHQQLGIRSSTSSSTLPVLPFIHLEIQEPLPDLDNQSELLGNFSLSSTHADRTNNGKSHAPISARASRAASRTRESGSSFMASAGTATATGKRRKNDTAEPVKMAVVDLTFDDKEEDSTSNDHTSGNEAMDEEKSPSDKDSMEMDELSLSRTSSSSSNFDKFLSKQSSATTENSTASSGATTALQRSSSPFLPHTTLDNNSNTSSSSSPFKASRLTINQVVQVPPFGYGHVIAIKEIQRQTNDPSVPIVIDDTPLSSGSASSASKSVEPVFGYTIDLWCGIKAYVTSDNPLWNRYCKNISDKTIARYPSWNSRGAVTLNLGDIYRLTPTVYLNDNTIEFYLRYTHTEQLLAYHRALSHVYGTFFYPLLGNRLRALQESWLLDPAKPFPPGTVTVKSIADMDPFSYQFLFIPINDKLHWSTAVVCYPGLLLPGRDGRGRIPLLQTTPRVNSTSSAHSHSSSLTGLSAVPNVIVPQILRQNSSSSTDASMVITEQSSNTNEGNEPNETSLTTANSARRGRKPKASNNDTVVTPNAEPEPVTPTIATASTGGKRSRKRDSGVAASTEMDEDSSPPKKIASKGKDNTADDEPNEIPRKSLPVVEIPPTGRSEKKAVAKTDTTEASSSRLSTVESGTNARATSKTLGRGSSTPTTTITSAVEADDDAPSRRRSARNKTPDTTDGSCSSSAKKSSSVTIDMTDTDNFTITGERSQMNPVLSDQLGKVFEQTQEINTQLVEAFYDKLQFSLTKDYVSVLLPPMEEVPPAVVKTIRTLSTSGEKGTDSSSRPRLISCEYSHTVNTNMEVLMTAIRTANPGGNSDTTTLSSSSASSDSSNQRTVGDDLDPELVFDHTNINLKDENEYTKYRNLLQQQVVAAEDRMKIHQQKEREVMNRVALEVHKKIENDRMKAERTVKFADTVSSTTDLTGNDGTYGSSSSSTEDLDPYLKKRDRAQTMAYNSAMNAAQVRSRVLSSPEVRTSIAEARKAVKDHIAASARLAHIECLYYQLLSRTANNFVTVGGLRSLIGTTGTYVENSEAVFTELCKLYDTQVQAYQSNPPPTSPTVAASAKGRRTKSNSSTSSTAKNDSAVVTEAMLQATWNLLQIVHRISHHFETLYNFLDDIISGLKARSLSYDQEYRKMKEELKSFATEYKTAVQKYNSLDNDLDAEVAVCSSPPTPCIILLDSLKMHRGQEIARRVRIYLEAEFRARYMSPAELIAVHKLQLAQRGNGRSNTVTEPSTSSSSSSFVGTTDKYGNNIAHSLPPVVTNTVRLNSDSAATVLSSSSSTVVNDDEIMDMNIGEESPTTPGGGFDDLQLQQQSTKGNDPLSMDFFLSALASAPGNRRKNLKNHTDPSTDEGKVNFAKSIIRRSKLVSAGGKHGKGGSHGKEVTVTAPSTNRSISDNENDSSSIIVTESTNLTSTGSRANSSTVPMWPWLSSIGSLFEAAKFPCKQPEHLPRQTNDYDCGLFALQYFESFCIPMLPHVTMEHLASISRMRSIFGDFFDLRKVEAKRNAIRSLILNEIAKRPQCVPPGSTTISTTANTTSTIPSNAVVSLVSPRTTSASATVGSSGANNRSDSKSKAGLSTVIALD